MNILWISNILFPEAQALLSGSNDILRDSGGWMLSSAEALVRQPNVHLYVASVSRRIRELTTLQGKNITYFIIPGGIKGIKRVNHGLEKYWREIHEIVKPDIIHIHGTEFTHGLAFLEACGPSKVCVSIQGLVNACSFYYFYGVSRSDIFCSCTLRSILRGGMIQNYRDFRRQSKSEIETINRVHHIIGRTTWDRAKVCAINPTVHYHFGGESLRKEFYEGFNWSYENCTPHSIFLSQSSYPIKGLHMVLRALPLVLRSYPDTKVKIAGAQIIKGNSWIKRFKLSDYAFLIDRLIRENGLEDVISFTGPLDANGMRKEYLDANLFICPSSVENSPNSVGEAQILGTPVVASYVGGIPDMMKGSEDCLYRFEEVEMLARKVIEVFDKAGGIETEAMRQRALIRHNPESNIAQLMSIYESVARD